ncbi:MAG: hypothetical protein M3401_13315 [Actinomycetota bacterium]|nr:hypothetical protein [Actinomycetota bacterium]
MTRAWTRLARRIRLLASGLLLCLAMSAVAAAQADAKPKERVVITGPVLVERGDTAGDVVVIDGDVLVRGTVDGDLIVVNGELTLRGRVTGDVVALADKVIVGDRGRIDGDLRYGDKKPEGATGDRVGGDVKRIDPESIGAPLGVGIAFGFWLAVTVSTFLLGLLLLALAPRAAEAVARAGRASPGKSLLIGLLAFILLPILAIVAFVTIVGIPLGLVVLFALVPLYAIAYTTSAWVLGHRILGPDRASILAFLAGLVILRLLALIPFASGLVWFLATLFGLGALFVAMGSVRKA